MNKYVTKMHKLKLDYLKRYYVILLYFEIKKWQRKNKLLLFQINRYSNNNISILNKNCF